MILDLIDVIRLTKEHFKQAVDISDRAFQEYPTSILMFPDKNERIKKNKFGFEMLYNYGFRYGEVYATSPNLEGVAMWLPPKKVHQSIWSVLRSGGFRVLRKTGIKAMKRGYPLYNFLGPTHKRLAPFDHWYLQLLAVEPEKQGKGYGSLLIRAMIKKIDLEGLPVYLETNIEKNVPFYQKHGFEVLDHAIIPKTDVPNWGMLRKPL
jgi:ribosomal protein S18 acetylase RimI-like enzyme